MKDTSKSEPRLLSELAEMRRRIAELEVLEKKYRTIVDNAVVGIYRTNLKGEILYVNEALALIAGYDSPLDMMSRNVLVFYKNPGVRERLIKNLKKSGKVSEFEMDFMTISGEVKKVLLSATLEGEIISGMIMDITSLKQTEAALRKSESKYRDLYDNAPDMYHSLNKDGIITDCNETEAKKLGYKKEEIIGRHFTEFITEESKRLFKKYFPKLNRDMPRLILEREYIKKDGTILPVSLSVFNESDENGEFAGTRTIARDITDRKKMEEEILKAQKLESISLLAGGIAHDFNNLLTAIFGNIAIAKAYAVPGEMIHERLHEAEKAFLRARDLTMQLLTFSKGGEPVKKSVSIGKLLKETISFTLSGSSVKSEFHIGGNLWHAEIDEGQISQVINNLAINAEQSMPEGGMLKVFCDNVVVDPQNILQLNEGRYVKIIIEDEGIGIPGEYLRKIFDPYFTTKQKGNGLGLAVAYSIVRKHNGCITVESELRAGTVFCIYLPASESEAFGDVKEKVFFTGSGRVLVMDDEEIVRNLAGEILKYIGYEAEFAAEGNEAVALYKKAKDSGQPFDAVILDLTIPGGVGGKATIKRLIEIDPDVKAIVSSGYSNDPVMADFRRYGFSEVVPKPYKIEELSEALYTIIYGEQ